MPPLFHEALPLSFNYFKHDYVMRADVICALRNYFERDRFRFALSSFYLRVTASGELSPFIQHHTYTPLEE